jgi:hypothetical protein
VVDSSRNYVTALNRKQTIGKGKAVSLQAWGGPESFRKLRFPDFMPTAQGGGKVVSITRRPHLPPGNFPGTHFCYRLSQPQGHSAIGRSKPLLDVIKEDTFSKGNELELMQ